MSLTSLFTDIADAIREKEGTTEPIPASSFAERILAIETGSSFAVPLIVNTNEGVTVTVYKDDVVFQKTVGADGKAEFTLTVPGMWYVKAQYKNDIREPEEIDVVTGYERTYSFSESRLPEGYTEVEYISFQTTGFVSTGVTASTYLRWVMDAEFPAPTADFPNPSGSVIHASPTTSSSQTRRFTLSVADETHISTWIGLASSNTRRTVSTTRGRILVDWDFFHQQLSWGSDTFSISSTSYNPSSKASFNMFAPGGKIYSGKIYSGDTLTRNFVPCIDPQGDVGMYEIVDGKFFKASSSEPVIAGPVV